MSNPTFSVVIPTYHRNDLLAKCLDCLKPGVQTLAADQYEVIVTDDGRTTTAEHLIQEHYPWVTWVAGPQKGPAANRNNGAKVAQGEWLVFTDDDCLPDPEWLLAFASGIVPDIQVYEGKTTCEVGLRSPLEHAPINLDGGYLWSCNMMIKTIAFWKVGGFDENFPYPHMEDVAFKRQLELEGYSFRFISTAIVDHPPKELPWGTQLGAYHESDIYYWFFKRKQPISKAKLLTQIIRYRLGIVIQYPFRLSSIKALASMCIETTHVFLKFDSWKQNLGFFD